jgi:tellurite resistance protein TerC
MYVFGAFLILTGIKLLFQKDAELHPERNPLFLLFMRFIPTLPTYRDERFFVRQSGRRYATPLFAVLISIEVTDLVFAIDSIPAIFAVTSDPFIVYTSNIFAILGLRSLYFLLAGIIHQFHYLKTGLAFILALVGVKMMIVDLYKVQVGLSLTVITVLIGGAIVASLLWPPKAKETLSAGAPHVVLD